MIVLVGVGIGAAGAALAVGKVLRVRERAEKTRRGSERRMMEVGLGRYPCRHRRSTPIPRRTET